MRLRGLRVAQITSARDLPHDELFARVERLGPAGAVVLRDPELSTRDLLALGRTLRSLTRRRGARLLVADRLDLALVLEADGVHLGRGSVSCAEARRLVGDRLVTRSAHDDAELDRALAEGADGVFLSPIYESPGKGSGLGVAALTAARARLPESVALVALGGITHALAASCLAAGADGVASIRADLTALASVPPRAG